MTIHRSYLVRTLLVSVVAVAAIGLPPVAEVDAHTQDVLFTDVRAQAREFLDYNENIKLSASQEEIKLAALGPMHAACCDDNSAYTCCCDCNLSGTVWGLANHLIAHEGYGAEQVAQKVTEWLTFVGPDGFSGDACYTGGCGRPFADNGCGGMNASQLVF